MRPRHRARSVVQPSQALENDDFAYARHIVDGYVTTADSDGDKSANKHLLGFEWRLLWQRTRGEQACTITNLASPATCLAFSLDGKTLLAGGEDGVHQWALPIPGQRGFSWPSKRTSQRRATFSRQCFRKQVECYAAALLSPRPWPDKRPLRNCLQPSDGRGWPAISVDSKKKELIGNFENQGQQWRREDTAERVKDHDFPDPSVPCAYPYGIYDLGRNTSTLLVHILELARRTVA
jgi:hypothetical protein